MIMQYFCPDNSKGKTKTTKPRQSVYVLNQDRVYTYCYKLQPANCNSLEQCQPMNKLHRHKDL